MSMLKHREQGEPPVGRGVSVPPINIMSALIFVQVPIRLRPISDSTAFLSEFQHQKSTIGLLSF